MLKKITSALLGALMLFSAAPTYAEDKVTVYLNEYFDNYALNSTEAGNISVMGGVDARVVSKSGADKAFFVKAWGDSVLLEAPIKAAGNKFTISADIMIDGAKTDATLFSLTDKSNKTIDLLNLSKEGFLTLGDGKKIGGMTYGKWKKLAFALDFSNDGVKTMDIYADGKQLLRGWKLFDSFSAPEKISFFVSASNNPTEKTDFWLDNLAAYSGTKLMPQYIPGNKTISNEVRPFEETEEINMDNEAKLFTYVDFDSSSSFSSVPKENIIMKKKLDDAEHNNVLYVCRDRNTNDAFIDINVDSAVSSYRKFIVEFDVYIIRNEYRITVYPTDVDNVSATGTFIYGGYTQCGGEKGRGVITGKWTKVSIIYDMTRALYSMCLDGAEVIKPQKIAAGRISPLKVRFGVSSGGSAVEYYMDNIRIYSGNEIHDFSDQYSGIKETADDEELKSIREKSSDALALIGNAIIFKDDVDALCIDNKKLRYSDVSAGYPYKTDDGVFMIPQDLLEKAFKIKAETDGETIKIRNVVCKSGEDTVYIENKPLKLDAPPVKKDGIFYLPCRSIARDILGMSYYYDRGMHIFDKSKFKYENSAAIADITEPIDTIYRFMQFERHSGKEIFSMAREYQGGNVHPRILTNPQELEKIKSYCRTDEYARKAFENTLKEANKCMNDDVQKYNIPDGIRLLVAARNVMNRCVTLSAAYLLTGDTKYADRIWKEFIGTEQIPGCLNWKDWNTQKHYLDNSELLYGVAVAFDSCYDYWTQEQKNIMMDKTYELSMKHSVAAYGGSYSGAEFRKSTGNWGLVCNGCIVSACLAFGLEGNEKYQKYYDYLLENALSGIEYPIMLFYPDGAWQEGFNYWEYATRYLFGSTLAPLYFSTGSTLGLINTPGVQSATDSAMYLQGGAGKAFNFGNMGGEEIVTGEAAYVVPMITGDSKKMRGWRDVCEKFSGSCAARTLMWYRPAEEHVEDKLPLDRYFISAEAGNMKEEWYNTYATSLFYKGERLGIQEHFDMGTFCLDTMGERWALDLGKGEYNIEGGYAGVNGLSLYVRRAEGHNCVVINPREDDPEKGYWGGVLLNSYATQTRSESKEKGALAVIDMSECYALDTVSFIRGFYLGDDRRTVTIQDEMNFIKPGSDFYWFMHTRAKIELDQDKKGAVLTLNGKKLRVEALSNATSFGFKVNKVEKRFATDPERNGQWQPNYADISVLTIEGTGSGATYLTVKFIPVDAEFDTYSKISYKPISEWSIPDGDKSPKTRADMIYADGKELEGFEKNSFEYCAKTDYGQPIPVITAKSNENVEIKQSNDMNVPSYVIVTNAKTGVKVTYTIKHEYNNTVTRAPIVGLKGETGIRDGFKVLYGTPSASYIPQPVNGPENLVDGDFSTRWAASGDGVTCQIDLGEVLDIDGIAVSIYCGNERQNIFRLQTSENGVNFTEVYDGKSTGLSGDNYESYMFKARARYIRYVGFGSTEGEWSSVLELGAIVRKQVEK